MCVNINTIILYYTSYITTYYRVTIQLKYELELYVELAFTYLIILRKVNHGILTNRKGSALSHL